MHKMEKVVRYKCAWCGKEFKTPDRHKCKWDPDSHNCLSCVYRGEYVKGEPTRRTGLDSWEEGYPAEFECFAPDGSGGWNEFQPITGASTINCERHCPSYKMIENWEGKKTYVAIEHKRNDEAFAQFKKMHPIDKGIEELFNGN